MTNQTISAFRGRYAFLSNFYVTRVPYEGLVYKTAEHAFQAAKTLDPVQRDEIRRALSATTAKELGRKVKLRPGWVDGVREQVMLDVLRAKFTTNPELSRLLLRTDDLPIIEGNNWHDTYWGMCLCQRHKETGENRLGQLLMQVRYELRMKDKVPCCAHCGCPAGMWGNGHPLDEPCEFCVEVTA